MTSVDVVLICPQDDKECVGEKKCKKDKYKGCAIKLMRIWEIEAEDRQACY